MTLAPEEPGGRVEAAIEGLRQRLEARHGWTLLDVRVATDTERRRLELRGEVVVHRMVDAVVTVTRDVVPPGWTVCAAGLRVVAGTGWRTLEPGVHRLFARVDRRTTGWGAWVELTDRDIPVEHLADVEDMTLVRGRDGTVGWLHRGLGDGVPARPLAPPTSREPSTVIAAARDVLGVRYRLGGATPDGIDCSALVQHAVDPLGIVVPRHSSDQLQVDARDGSGPSGEGDLVFAWNEREALCHVGLCTGASVVHASRSRGEVVEDDVAVFERDAQRLMHVPFPSLLEFAERVAGYDSLIAAGFVLGRGA